MKKLLIILTTTISLNNLKAQSLDTVQITNKQSVLNGRAFFNIPNSAKQEGRTANIMSADYNNNEETRFVFDIGKMRLVLFAKEVYLKADENFKKAITESNKSKGFDTKILTDKDSIISILSTPTKFDKTKQAILINNLLVKTQDQTIFRFDAFINTDAFDLKTDYQKLTEKIFASLIKGNRINKLNERIEVLPTLNDKVKLSFKIPNDYCITIDKKYDFQVYKYHKFQNFSEANDFEELIIYTGFYPSMVYKDLNKTEADAKKVKGQLLGQNIEWLQFEEKSQGIIDREQKVNLNKVQDRMVLHIAMISNQEKTIDKLTTIVEQIKVEE